MEKREVALWIGAAAAAVLVSRAATSAQDSPAEELKGLIALTGDGLSPGVQYVHASGDSVLTEYQGGVVDVGSGVPVSRDTTFMAFSVTKTFTALAILQLAEEKKISLDDPIEKHLDFFPYKQSPTIRQTLNHTAGFPNPIPLAWSHLETEHAGFKRDEFLRSVLAANPELKSAPGKKFAYSNIGYLLLGRVIERASGHSYEEYVQKHIIERLNLRKGETLTFVLPENGLATGYLKRFSLLNLAAGWLFERDRFIAGRHGSWNYFRRYYVNGSAYGGLSGNAAGFTRYLQAFLPGGVFSGHAKQVLAVRPGEAGFPVSMGWYKGKIGGIDYFSHAGGGGGYYCEIRFYPALSRTSVIMLNRTGVSDERLLDEIDPPFLKM